MAGSSTFPTSVDNKTQLQDGVDYMEADNINNAYVPGTATQTFVGANGKGASWSTDILEYLANTKAPICTKSSATQLSISAGTVFIKNAAQSNRLMRRNTAATTVDIANLDSGTTVSVAYYAIYAVADSAATTFTVVISTSFSSPSGLTNFELIGYFYNQTAGSVLDIAIDWVGNIKAAGRDVPNKMTAIGTSNITTTSASDVLMTDMQLRFRSTGRPVLILADAIFEGAGNGCQVQGSVFVDSSEKRRDAEGGAAGTQAQRIQIHYVEALSEGNHLIELYWKRLSGSDTIQQNGATYKRELTAIEL